jgi:hypothetical protein
MRVPQCLTTARTPVFLAVTGTFCLLWSNQLSAAAAGLPISAPKANTVQVAIAQLEEKLYEHKYPAETDEARLARIEKFVFGAAQSGTNAERLARLQSSITTTATDVSADKAPQIAGQNKPIAAPSDAVTSTPAFDSANYPRVTELEHDMLNTTYVHETLPQRLSRLETKAFGNPSKSNDLCARVDDLDEYAETHKIFKNHQDPLASGPLASSTRPGVFSNSTLARKGFSLSSPPEIPDDSVDDTTAKAPVNPFVNGVNGTDQRLSAIEEFVYGHNYANRPAQDRLERLEKRLVPYQHNLAQRDVNSRVNNLWNILNVANTLKSAPTAAYPANTQAIATAPPSNEPASHGISAPSQSTLTQATEAHHSWLHQLGKSLGSANVSNGKSNVPGQYPPGMGPQPGHLWFP